MSARVRSDTDALDNIAARFLGPDSYDDASSALESISKFISETGRKIEGWEENNE